MGRWPRKAPATGSPPRSAAAGPPPSAQTDGPRRCCCGGVRGHDRPANSPRPVPHRPHPRGGEPIDGARQRGIRQRWRRHGLSSPRPAARQRGRGVRLRRVAARSALATAPAERKARVQAVGDAPFLAHANLDMTLEVLDSQIRGHVALHAPDRVLVHAGVVGIGKSAIVIPGGSFSGRTTLVAEFIRAGDS